MLETIWPEHTHTNSKHEGKTKKLPFFFSYFDYVMKILIFINYHAIFI
jgi:hypothetical protein